MKKEKNAMKNVMKNAENSAENGEIPWCDAETQAAFDAFIADNPGYYYWDGDLQQAWQNGSLYVPMEGETEGKE